MTYDELRQEAEAIEKQSWKEQGTHAAYMRGYAAGILHAARSLRQTKDYEALVSAMKETEK